MRELIDRMEAALDCHNIEADRAERVGDQSDKIVAEARAAECSRWIFELKAEVKRGNKP